MMTCPHCQPTDQQVKVGFNRSGSQRCLCQACKRKYTPAPIAQGYDAAKRQTALQMYVDGMNLRRNARALKITHPTLAPWVDAHAAQLPDFPPQPATTTAVNELHELFTFVGSKKKSRTLLRK